MKAQQEVPAWLEEIAGGIAGGIDFSNPRGNTFASVDSRKVIFHYGGGGGDYYYCIISIHYDLQ